MTTTVAGIYVKMSTTMDNDLSDLPEFPEWLLAQINDSGLSKSEFARRVGISRQAVSNYLNQQRAKPDDEVIRKLADYLHLAEEDVFRIARVLQTPPDPDKVPGLGQWIKLYLSSSDEKRKIMLDNAEYFANRSEEKDRI